ncbi:hypothetical protein OH77DRAFT_1520915 [Trametes cingulata]|nr:hypothetical protein OH77DRAFT_1520915 [Trametes cingulata]
MALTFSVLLLLICHCIVQVSVPKRLNHNLVKVVLIVVGLFPTLVFIFVSLSADPVASLISLVSPFDLGTFGPRFLAGHTKVPMSVTSLIVVILTSHLVLNAGLHKLSTCPAGTAHIAGSSGYSPFLILRLLRRFTTMLHPWNAKIDEIRAECEAEKSAMRAECEDKVNLARAEKEASERALQAQNERIGRELAAAQHQCGMEEKKTERAIAMGLVFKAECEEKGAQVVVLESTVEQLRAEIEEAGAEKDAIAQDAYEVCSAMQKAHIKTVQKKDATIKDLRQTMKEVDDDRDRVAALYMGEAQHNTKLGKENTELKEKNTELKEENTELKEENTELKKNNIELEKKNAELAKEKVELLTTLDEHKSAQNVTLTCRLEDKPTLQKLEASRSKAATAAENTVASVTMETEDTAVEKVGHQLACAKDSDAYQRLLADFTARTAELETLKDRMQDMRAEMDGQQDRAFKDMQMHAEESGRALRTSVKLEGRLARMGEKNVHLQLKLQKCEAQMQDYRHYFETAERQRYAREQQEYKDAQRRSSPRRAKVPVPPALVPPRCVAVDVPRVVVTSPSTESTASSDFEEISGYDSHYLVPKFIAALHSCESLAALSADADVEETANTTASEAKTTRTSHNHRASPSSSLRVPSTRSSVENRQPSGSASHGTRIPALARQPNPARYSTPPSKKATATGVARPSSVPRAKRASRSPLTAVATNFAK